MKEENIIFKGYLRGLMRQYVVMKEALEVGDYDKAENLLEGLIEDTQKGIED